MSISKREEYQIRMDEELALWSARFEALKTQAGKEAKAPIASQLESWHAAMETAAAKLVELKRTEGDAWDAVKVELEQAWHAIEKVLDQGVVAAPSRLITTEEMHSLTAEQQDAILEAMVMAVVIDGKIGQDEIARFDKELRKVPWAQPKEEVLKKAQAARARIAALANDDERDAMLKSIAARLPAGPIAEKTLGMMAMVMTADGPVNAAEKTYLAAFATAFGITRERMVAIGESLVRG